MLRRFLDLVLQAYAQLVRVERQCESVVVRRRWRRALRRWLLVELVVVAAVVGDHFVLAAAAAGVKGFACDARETSQPS